MKNVIFCYFISITFEWLSFVRPHLEFHLSFYYALNKFGCHGHVVVFDVVHYTWYKNELGWSTMKNNSVCVCINIFYGENAILDLVFLIDVTVVGVISMFPVRV